MMEKTIEVLIYIHATFGGLALASGMIALIAKKGKNTHKWTGKLFYKTMLASGFTAMLIAVLPKHENPFLFAVGIFSMYFVLTGERALHLKEKEVDLKFDKCIAITMIVTGVLMITLPLLLAHRINIILTVFGFVGLLFAVRDLIRYKDRERLKKEWLKLHLGKMIGGYISATTAFVVVNDYFPSIYGWFVPGIIGAFIIIYWLRKLSAKNKATTSALK